MEISEKNDIVLRLFGNFVLRNSNNQVYYRYEDNDMIKSQFAAWLQKLCPTRNHY